MLGLIKYALAPRRGGRHFGAAGRRPAANYDVVVIGGGGHGLAAAYYLARVHKVRRVAVLERGYIGGGNTGRNTAVIRANYLTPEGVRFYRESLKLFADLSGELEYNIMYSRRGQMTLAHTDAALRSFRWRAEMNKCFGVNSEVVDIDEVRRRVPPLSLSDAARYPIIGGLWHADGATARHDAVAWGYARAAARLGVEIYPLTEVVGVRRAGGRAVAVQTARGEVGCGAVLQAVSGASSQVAAMVGVRLPIVSYPLQAMVTQPLKPFLHPHVSSPQLHCYLHQTARGEVVIGGGSDPYPLHSVRSTPAIKEHLAAGAVQLFPFLRDVRVLRQWTGVTDMTPDYSPIMGPCAVANYYLDAGWGTWGFKATPIAGRMMAECIAAGRVPDLIAPFALSRFAEMRQVNEMGATAAGH